MVNFHVGNSAKGLHFSVFVYSSSLCFILQTATTAQTTVWVTMALCLTQSQVHSVCTGWMLTPVSLSSVTLSCQRLVIAVGTQVSGGRSHGASLLMGLWSCVEWSRVTVTVSVCVCVCAHGLLLSLSLHCVFKFQGGNVNSLIKALRV